MVFLLHLSSFSACLDAFGPWDLSVECQGLGMAFLNLVFPMKHLRQALLSHSSPPAAAAGEENWKHKKVKITGWDEEHLLETAMR